MYADRYTSTRRFSPGGLAAAVGINAGVVAALMVAVPMVTGPAPVDPPLDTYSVPIEPPPPVPPAPMPRTELRPQSHVDAPTPPLPVPPIDTWPQVAQPDPAPSAGPALDLGSGGGTGTGGEAARPAPPVIVAPSIDPRYAADFQPAYPAAEQRMGAAGRVTVRVLIGTDGRVKQVERVDAASDAFYRATEQQALRRWRFRPGTRDGVTQEVWRTMTVTFVMTD